MSIDLILHAGTKFALHQWLDARGLGDNVQDTDPNSPTFGDYEYTHTAEGSFYYWNHPSGVVTNYAGFYALLRFPDADSLTAPRYKTITEVVDEVEVEVVDELPSLSDWVSTRTAVAVLDDIAGVGGEGITILDPEDLRAAVVAGGGALWGGLLGVGHQWSDPRLWAFSNVMTGDQREFGGKTYESLIDFNVWSPTQYPAGWAEVVAPEPPATPEWTVGTAYSVGDEVTYQGATYRCLQAHTALAGWTPVVVPALWSAI